MAEVLPVIVSGNFKGRIFGGVGGIKDLLEHGKSRRSITTGFKPGGCRANTKRARLQMSKPNLLRLLASNCGKDLLCTTHDRLAHCSPKRDSVRHLPLVYSRTSYPSFENRMKNTFSYYFVLSEVWSRQVAGHCSVGGKTEIKIVDRPVPAASPLLCLAGLIQPRESGLYVMSHAGAFAPCPLTRLWRSSHNTVPSNLS